MAQRRQRGAPIEDAKPLTIGNNVINLSYINYHIINIFIIANLPEAERSKISRLVERYTSHYLYNH